MEGYRIHEWGGVLAWETIPDPTVGSGEALVEVEACGIGLTVLNCIAGNLADDRATLPRVPGHELVGKVTEVGAGVDHALVGRRVVAYFYLFCGTCPACVAGRQQRCRRLAGWVGVHRDGGYAPLAALPARNLIPVPDELDPVGATVVPDAVATPVHVSHRAGIGPEDRVAVIGAGGGVGAHMVQVALSRGAAVAGLDLTDPKLELIESLEAAAVRSEDFTRLGPGVVAGDRPTVVIDLVGTAESTVWSLEALDTGGRYLALTTFPGRSAPVASRDLVFRELSLLGSRYATREEVSEAAKLVAEGEVRPILGAVGGPGEVEDVHQALRSQALLGRGALDWRGT